MKFQVFKSYDELGGRYVTPILRSEHRSLKQALRKYRTDAAGQTLVAVDGDRKWSLVDFSTNWVDFMDTEGSMLRLKL